MPKHLQRTTLIKLFNKVADMKLSTVEAVEIVLTHVSENYVLRPLSFEEWQEENSDQVSILLAETGADRELDFNPENELDTRYNEYLRQFSY